MEGTEKTIAYAFAAACVLGIIIVGALVLTSHTTEEEFSEIYFEDPDRLPSMVKIGDKIDFAFTTISHEKKQTAYDYKVTYDGHDIMSGSFSLEPSSSKTINVNITPENTSQVKMTDPVVNLSKMKYKAASCTISRQDDGFDRMELLPPPNGYSLVLCGANAIRLQIMDSVGLLIFDPKLKESYNTSFRTVIPEVRIASSDGPFLSNLGYMIRRDDWNIVNDRGNIDIMHKNSSTIYRYGLKKVSVKVSSANSEIRGAGAKPAVSETRTGSEYEIHFRITVKEDPDKLLNIL
ncbi:MAG: hypothetical protein WCP70_14170 [Methanothrix sp.]